MGFDRNGLRFLLAARPTVERTLTIGRQEIHAPRAVVRKLFEARGLAVPAVDDGFAEPVLLAMGAQSVDSLDASDFEGATIIHDLNRPMATPPRRFTCVIDAGTLEHVFNFPVAVRTCMELVEPGGHLVIMVPSNNELGHGLYQFCPELFYRVLERDFEVEHMLLVERGSRPTWYSVTDPKAMGNRVMVKSRRSTYLMLQARRTTHEAIADLVVQASDYESRWADVVAPPRSLGTKVANRLAWHLGTQLQGRIGSQGIRRVKL